MFYTVVEYNFAICPFGEGKSDLISWLGIRHSNGMSELDEPDNCRDKSSLILFIL
jgi:hypothetical protein